MTATVTLPTGEVVATQSRKLYLTIVDGRRVASSDERGRALSQWRRWQRNTPDSRVWLVDRDGHVVRPILREQAAS